MHKSVSGKPRCTHLHYKKIEEHGMLNLLKANRKLMNAVELKEPRLGMFKELMVLS